MLNEAEARLFSYRDESEFLNGSFAVMNNYLCVIIGHKSTTIGMNILASVWMSDVKWLRLILRVHSN